VSTEAACSILEGLTREPTLTLSVVTYLGTSAHKGTARVTAPMMEQEMANNLQTPHASDCVHACALRRAGSPTFPPSLWLLDLPHHAVHIPPTNTLWCPTLVLCNRWKLPGSARFHVLWTGVAEVLGGLAIALNTLSLPGVPDYLGSLSGAGLLVLVLAGECVGRYTGSYYSI